MFMKTTPFLLRLMMALLLLLVSVGCSEGDEEPTINGTADFEAYLEDQMEDQNIPALAVLIFKDNTILYEKYAGKSNIEQNLALESDHLFLLASVSKVVTGSALLLLHEAGRFALDDPINDYLPFAVRVPGTSNDITFRMLLTHTSGIADGSALDGQYYYGEDSPVELSFFLENYLVPGGRFYNARENFHDFEPGTDHEYSNIGSALIGVLVEEISGLDFNTFCKQNIFSPLGMQETFWRLDEIRQTIATPYDEDNRGRLKAITQYTFTDYPNGGLRSTARDMFKFWSALMNGRLLSPNMVNAMFSPQIPTLNSEVGLHAFLMNASNNLWGHDGGEQGAATIVAFNPTTKVGAVILANQGEADLDNMLVQAYRLGLTL